MREREVKLAVTDGLAAPDLTDLTGPDGVAPDAEPRPTVTKRVVDRYFDSADLRLARWGCTLRHRDGDGWTVKLPSTGSGPTLDREEIDYPDRPAATLDRDDGGDCGDGESSQPGGPGGLGGPPVEAMQLVSSLLRGAAVGLRATLRTCRTRQQWQGANGELLFEIDDDEVYGLAEPNGGPEPSDGGGREVKFRQIEVELAPTADEGLLAAVVERYLAAGAWYDEPVPKLMRVLGEVPAPDVVEPVLGPEPTAREVIGSALARSIAHLLVHLPVARHGVDPEGIHQARVATRRLRSDLRTFGPLLNTAWAASLQDELRWLAAELGRVRDADVLLARFAATLDAHPEIDAEAGGRVVAALEAQRADDRAQLLDHLDDDRSRRLLDHLVEAAADPRTAPQADDPATERLGGLVRKRWRRLQRTVDGLGPEPRYEQLHEVRILAKRVRYATQAVGPAYPSTAPPFAKAITAIQDVLGELNDAEVAVNWLRQAADRLDPEAVFAAGRMAQVLFVEGVETLGEWERAYRQAARPKLRAWFRR